MKPPRLVLAWGNRSRGDDALGPLFAEQVEGEGVEVIEDMQLQPEHALDLAGRAHVLFVDASLSAAAPFELRPLVPARDASFSTHALSPQALLQVALELDGRAPPATLLAIRGECFTLGEWPSAAARRHLAAALAWYRGSGGLAHAAARAAAS